MKPKGRGGKIPALVGLQFPPSPLWCHPKPRGSVDRERNGRGVVIRSMKNHYKGKTGIGVVIHSMKNYYKGKIGTGIVKRSMKKYKNSKTQ